MKRWDLALAGLGLLVAVSWTGFPSMVRSEVLEYAYALLVLVGISMLRPAFSGAARQWWLLALGLQLWHYCEHFLVVMQVGTGWRLAGEPMPTSILQLLAPRVDMHEFYNAIVTIPMVVAIILRALDSRAHVTAPRPS